MPPVFDRRRFLTSAMASAGWTALAPHHAYAGTGSPQCQSIPNGPTALPAFNGTPLGTIAAGKNLDLGIQMGLAPSTAYGAGMYDPVYQQAVFREKPAFICYGSAFKFADVCPDPPAPNGALVFTHKAYGVTNTWSTAQDLTSLVRRRGLRARADALVWNVTYASPSWLKALPPQATFRSPEYTYNIKYLVQYLSAAFRQMTVMQAGRPDFFTAVGLANEPINPNYGDPQNPFPAVFRDGPWLPPGMLVTPGKVPPYITTAFKWGEYYRNYWASKLGVAPTTAKFFLNEVLCDTDQYGRAVRPALLTLLKSMLDAKLNIQAVGLECHLHPQMMYDAYHPDWTEFGDFIQAIGDLGLDVYLTEFDVNDYETSCFGKPGTNGDSDYLVELYYDSFLSKVLGYKNVKSVTLWDLSDRYTFYRAYDISRMFNYDEIPRPKPAGTWPNCPTMPATATSIACPRPNPYDDAMKPKGSRQKISNALAAAPRR